MKQGQHRLIFVECQRFPHAGVRATSAVMEEDDNVPSAHVQPFDDELEDQMMAQAMADSMNNPASFQSPPPLQPTSIGGTSQPTTALISMNTGLSCVSRVSAMILVASIAVLQMECLAYTSFSKKPELRCRAYQDGTVWVILFTSIDVPSFLYASGRFLVYMMPIYCLACHVDCSLSTFSCVV